MRKYLVLSAVAACVLVAVPSSMSFAGSSTYYAGTNSQHEKLFFSVDQIGGSPHFDPFFTTMIDHCPATGQTITIGFSFSGFEFPIKNGKFNVNFNDPSDLFNWSGTVTATKATGTQSYSMAAFDREGGLQDCTTGAVSWTAKALNPGSPRANTTHTTYKVAVTKDSDGSVHFSVTH